MKLEELMLRLREEQLEAGAWKTEEPEEPEEPRALVEPVRTCLRCRVSKIGPNNRSNLCRCCHNATPPKTRALYAAGIDPLAIQCVVCGAKFRGTRSDSRMCNPCRDNGWTAARCTCGDPLHRNDQWAHGIMKNRCSRCRRDAISDRYPTLSRAVVVRSVPRFEGSDR